MVKKLSVSGGCQPKKGFRKEREGVETPLILKMLLN